LQQTDEKGSPVARSRALRLSRLTIAWLALAAICGVLALVVIATPAPDGPEARVDIPLPPSPDRFAAGPAAPGSDPAPLAPETTEPLPNEDIGAPSGPARLTLREIGAGVGEADAYGEGEVVITVPDARAAAATVTSSAPGTPDAALIATTETGQRPKVAADGRTPFETYRRKGAAVPPRSVAILVTGLGLDRALTERAIAELPADVALGFAPYARDLSELLTRAMADGHEVVLEIPMEAAGTPDAALGPAGLLTTRSLDANAERLDWILSRAPAYPMVTNYLGHTFAADDRLLGATLATIKTTGAAYIDDTGHAAPVAAQLGLPHATVELVVAPGTGADPEALARYVAGIPAGPTRLVKVYAEGGGIDAVLAVLPRLAEGPVGLVPASEAVKVGP
jgi:polysaccharide deacetylase 2 family uncharacterized protein YibQ